MKKEMKSKLYHLLGLNFNEEKHVRKMTRYNYLLGLSFVAIFSVFNICRFVLLLTGQWYISQNLAISLVYGGIAFVFFLSYLIVMIQFFKGRIKSIWADIIYNFFVFTALMYDLQVGFELKMMLGTYFPLYIIMIYIFFLSQIRPIISIFFYLIVAYLLSMIWISHKGYDSNTMQQIYLLSIYIISLIRYYMSDKFVSNAVKLEEANQKLEVLSTTDSLTKISNRFALMQDFKKYLGRNVIVMFFDIDDFKYINDHYSHEAGDHALFLFANRLMSFFPDDVCYRYGGDEFVIIREHTKDNMEKIFSLKEQLTSFSIHSPAMEVTCSIGYQIGKCTDEETYFDLINKADAQLHHVKAGGKQNIQGSNGLAD